MSQKTFLAAEKIFRQNAGILRTGQAKKLGIPATTLVRMSKAGRVVREARGLYRLADLPL